MRTRPLKQQRHSERSRPFAAYDLETTRIEAGTPDVLYLTAYSDMHQLVSLPITSNKQFVEALEGTMLHARFNRFRYIAWNGNRFDALLVINKIIEYGQGYTIRPYLTRTGILRGARIERNGQQWELLDGIALSGLTGWPLRKFLEKFAPEFPKGDLDFEKESFNAENPAHVAYAERDSIGLYYALRKLDDTLRSATQRGFTVTIGNAGIKNFIRNIPEGVVIWEPTPACTRFIHDYAQRGGYCWVSRQYKGPLWQYDLNQAYAAAMRDTRLPAGLCRMVFAYVAGSPGIYQATISRSLPSALPFYCRMYPSGERVFCFGAPTQTWITSTEIAALRRQGWRVSVDRGYIWHETFNMASMVADLEAMRLQDYNGPIGIVAKSLGNNAYGKTVEKVEPWEYLVCRTQPKGTIAVNADDDGFKYFWMKRQPYERTAKIYHRPQIGCFITAHVRMIVWEAALADSDHFIKADTDSIAFTRKQQGLDVHPTRYGAWKLEQEGRPFMVIGKKVYASVDMQDVKAKGLHVRNLTLGDFENWLAGRPPQQEQLQKQGFRKFIAGAPLFVRQKRRGTDIASVAPWLIGTA